MSDERDNPAMPARTQPGVGHYSAFMCGRCNKPKGTTGRRLQLVLGLRTWVCAGCVRPK